MVCWRQAGPIDSYPNRLSLSVLKYRQGRLQPLPYKTGLPLFHLLLLKNHPFGPKLITQCPRKGKNGKESQNVGWRVVAYLPSHGFTTMAWERPVCGCRSNPDHSGYEEVRKYSSHGCTAIVWTYPEVDPAECLL